MEKDLISLSVVSPEGMLYEGNVRYVQLPGLAGLFSVLPGHAPLLTALTSGSLKFKGDGQTHFIRIKSGFVEVSYDVVSVCVEKDEDSGDK